MTMANSSIPLRAAADVARWAPPYGCPTITSLICMTGFRSV